MSRTFKANPYELSPDQKEARKAEARAERLARREQEEDRHWEEGTGPASDGRVLNAIGDGSNRLMDGPLADMARGAGFEDPDAELGSLIAGAGEQIRIRRGRGVPEQAAPTPVEDSPPLELRMPK